MNDWTPPKSLEDILAINAELAEALEGLGALPDGYCFCFGQGYAREGMRPESGHTGECQAARAALAKARGEG